MTSRVFTPALRQPRFFGRGRRYVFSQPTPAASGFGDDARLFATTFVGGLLFMTVYLA